MDAKAPIELLFEDVHNSETVGSKAFESTVGSLHAPP